MPTDLSTDSVDSLDEAAGTVTAPSPGAESPPQATAAAARPRPSLAHGAALIADYVKRLPQGPGVYRMLDHAGDALYVGKARSLKKRVFNYTQVDRLPIRLKRMVAETQQMEFVSTHTEAEALLLEANLIKKLKPRFNVLLRDDKSFPHILLTRDHPFPMLAKHRGAQSRKGDYFGPFASAGSVERTITALARAFLLRTCADTVFTGRTRPCLQYQIRRCTAPCVGLVTPQDYAEQVAQAHAFLEGKSDEVQARLQADMRQRAQALEFEQAARLRDRIRALAAIQSQQSINVEGVNDADILALDRQGDCVCIQLFFVRGGRNYGNRAFFPAHVAEQEDPAVLSSFLIQFYEDQTPPPLLLLSHALPEQALVAEALGVVRGGKVEIAVPKRGEKKRLVEMAASNAREAGARRLAESSTQTRLLEGVQTLFDLARAPRRIEVYDNSHVGGTDAYGAMIVAGPEGLNKQAYRKFAIKGAIEAGDDYAMMREVLGRRFSRALKEDPDRSAGTWPDLVLIDGGQGQLSAATGVMAELGLQDVPLVAIAKGPDRNAGRERFFMAGRAPFQLPPNDPVLFFLQRLRDEVHRFVIGTHRAARSKRIEASGLDEIAGIGPTRKRALLNHFGSARSVARAGLADLEAVPGVSRTMARTIYEHFHGTRL